MPSPSTSVARRHARWLVPLVGAPVLYVAAMFGVSTSVDRFDSTPTLSAGLLALGLLALALVGPVVLLLVTLVRVLQIGREARLRAGRYTRSERAAMAQQAAVQEAAAGAWYRAVQAAQALVRGESLPTAPVWDVAPVPGEVFYADVPIECARYYGTSAYAHQTSGVFVGHPAFVLAGLAGTALANASARSAARRQAADQWREHSVARLVVSDHRLLVQRSGQWLTFHHSGLTAVYPDPERRGLVCQYHDTSPLLLRGHWAPMAAVIVLATSQGAASMLEHPAMAAIAASVREPAREPLPEEPPPRHA